MSSRKEEKERLRRERLAKEEQRRRAERRRRLRIAAGASVVAVIAVIGLVALKPWEAGPPTAFGYSPEGVEERVERAGMRPGNGPHVHAKLDVVVRDEKIEVPDDMGLGSAHQPMHTHEPDGTIHLEGIEEGTATIGQFMALWGVEFGRDRLGPYRSDGRERVRMWVKEKNAQTFKQVPPEASFKLADGQELYLFFGPPSQAPIA